MTRARTQGSQIPAQCSPPPRHLWQVGHTDPGSVGDPPARRACLTRSPAPTNLGAVDTFGFVSSAVCCPGQCPIYSVKLLPRATVSFQRKTELSFPQEPMTSQGAPTTSCGGRHPRSSRRPTNLWGIGATRTCSESCSAPLLFTCLSVQATDPTALGLPQALQPTPRGTAPFLEPRPGPLPLCSVLPLGVRCFHSGLRSCRGRQGHCPSSHQQS